MLYDTTPRSKWLRWQIHKLLDDKFGLLKNEQGGYDKRNARRRYGWLKKHTTTSHMSKMDRVELEALYYQLLSESNSAL